MIFSLFGDGHSTDNKRLTIDEADVIATSTRYKIAGQLQR